MLPLPTLEEIEQVRLRGYRPEVMVGIVLKDKILFLYKEEYNLWQFIQGGVEPGETVSLAAIRESAEELGEEFAEQLRFIGLVHIDNFPLNHQDVKTVQLSTGQELPLSGKYFYCVIMEAAKETIALEYTEFDDYAWLDRPKAYEFAGNIYQKGKRRVTLAFLEKIIKELNI